MDDGSKFLESRSTLTAPKECPCCTQQGRLFWRGVNGTGEHVLVCEECFATWKEGDEIVCSNGLLMGDRLDAKGRMINWNGLYDLSDPPPMPGTRTESNRAQKRRSRARSRN